MSEEKITGKSGRIRVQQDGLHLYIIFNEKEYTRMPYQAAFEVADSIKKVAKMCQALDKIEDTIADQQILCDMGIPIQLIQNKHAALAGIPSSQIVGEPKIIVHNH